MRGYKFTLCRINSQLLLQIDVCSRVVRMETLLDTISKMSKDKIEMELKDAIVVTRYGRRRTYKLVEVDFSKSPKS